MRYHASELFQISELQTNSFWNIVFGEGPLKHYAQALEKRVTASELPKPELRNITVGVHGYEFEIPGTINYKAQITLTFVEPVDAKVSKAVDEWLRKIYRRGHQHNVKGVQTVKHYELFQNFNLIPYNREDIKTQVFHCHKAIINAWDMGGGLEDGNSPDVWKPTITFTVNWFNWETENLRPS